MFTSEILRSSPETFLDLRNRNYTVYTTNTPNHYTGGLKNLVYEHDRYDKSTKDLIMFNLEVKNFLDHDFRKQDLRKCTPSF